MGKSYATTKRGTVEFPIGSKQDKYMHLKNIDHSHVHVTDGKKTITRYGKNY